MRKRGRRSLFWPIRIQWLRENFLASGVDCSTVVCLNRNIQLATADRDRCSPGTYHSSVLRWCWNPAKSIVVALAKRVNATSTTNFANCR